MSEVVQLISTIKRQLKSQGLTYKDVALALKVSEPSVKRLFASNRLTVDRLEQLCSLLGFTLAELVQQVQTGLPQIKTLTTAQESQLISDAKLLLVAVCALNHWAMADMVETYDLSEVDCLKCLLQLDRLGLIRLLPGNRIRLAVARDFDWLPNGPIRQYFREQCQAEFLDSTFAGPYESMMFVHGMFTAASFAELKLELARLRKRFAELHEEGIAVPREQKGGLGLMLAMRGWEPEAFTRLRRVRRA